MTSARVHWLTGSTYLPVGDVLDMVHRLTAGGEFQVMAGRWFYGKRYRTVEGIEVMTEPRDPENMPPVVVNVPGAGCDLLGAAALRELALVLKPTRLDFAWDDVPFSVADVRGWVEDGNMRTRFRSATAYRSLLASSGDGIALGTRNASAEVVVYDRRGPVRLEMRLRGERAAAAYEVLNLAPSEWSGSFAELLRGLVDFVDRSQTSRADRAPLLPSWETFVSDARRVVVTLGGAVAASFERTAAFLHRQVARSLYMAHRAGLSLEDLLDAGKKRMRPSDRVTLHGWRSSAPALTPTA